MLNSQECNELLECLVNTNQLLSTLLSDPLIPSDNKGYIRSRYNLNQRIIECAKEELKNG